jgi:hypothetical protein
VAEPLRAKAPPRSMTGADRYAVMRNGSVQPATVAVKMVKLSWSRNTGAQPAH